MLFGLFRKAKENKESSHLDEKVVNLVDKALDKAEKIMESNPAEAFQYLKKANDLYGHLEKQKGYDFERVCRLNDLTFLYIRRYVNSQ